MLLIILLSILLFIIYSHIVQKIYTRFKDKETMKNKDKLWLLFNIVIFFILCLVLYILIFEGQDMNDTTEEIKIPEIPENPEKPITLSYEKAKEIARMNLLRKKYDLVSDNDIMDI